MAECWCRDCNVWRKDASGLPYNSTRMIVCPDCGNKRCPKATLHLNECTRSNAPGQPGSYFGDTLASPFNSETPL